MPKILLEDFKPQFSKLGPVGKNGPKGWFFHFFHSKSTEMDEKQYNDPI